MLFEEGSEVPMSKCMFFSLIRCPVMLVVGESSPHQDDTVEFNGRLDPTNSTWMKVGVRPGLVLPLFLITNEAQIMFISRLS